MQKKALGKGLGALISGVSGAAKRQTLDVPPAAETPAPPAAQIPPGERVVKVPIGTVHSSPFQPRKTFRDEQLTELMESISEHGIIQPLVVRRVNGGLELIAGERRYRACQKLGLTEVPVIEREASDRDVLEMALIENLQREDLNPVEEAEAYSRLAREFELRQEDIAKRVGKNRATVANAMRLLELAPEVKSLLAQGRISTGHAKAILGLREPELQKLVADMVVRQNMTVRQTEQHVQREQQGGGKKGRGKKGATAPAAMSQVEAIIQRIQNRLRERFATHVTIQHGEKKGRIEIDYYGDDDLGRLLEILGVEVD
jgi:ParB family transcriptional regulator, chromosome partitioning protein